MREISKDKYKPTCVPHSYVVRTYYVSEYVVECYEEDEDGDFVCGSDINYVFEYFFDVNKDDIVIEPQD